MMSQTSPWTVSIKPGLFCLQFLAIPNYCNALTAASDGREWTLLLVAWSWVLTSSNTSSRLSVTCCIDYQWRRV